MIVVSSCLFLESCLGSLDALRTFKVRALIQMKDADRKGS